MGTRLLLAGLLLLPAPALAWGPEGHEVIAHIAARELTPKAKAQVSALLGGDAEAMMVADSNWADEIRDARPDTARWHFVDIPLGSAGFVRARDCPDNDCVVGQIEADARIVADSSQPNAKRAFISSVMCTSRCMPSTITIMAATISRSGSATTAPACIMSGTLPLSKP